MNKQFWQNLGVTPYDNGLYKHALTHPSALKNQQKKPENKFEHFEFLGDRVLGLIIAEYLVQTYPHESEGTLAKRQGALVNKDVLKQIAQKLALGEFMIANRHDLNAPQSSILSDCVEAIIAAIYLDQGLDVTRIFILKQWENFLKDETAHIDPKSVLQEWFQKKYKTTPRYVLVDQIGPDHAPQFHVRLSLENFGDFDGIAETKRIAEKQAAARALQKIKIQNDAS